ASTQEVRVHYATANGSAKTSNKDYLAASGTIRFAPGQTTHTITITINGDTKKENNESFKVKLSSAVNGEIEDGQGLGTILNDDAGRTSKARHRASWAWAVDAAMEDVYRGRLKKHRR
ncbi:MAG TPA: Calx-beta domain-containing protein, partial [Pirellulaceae bacterium]|nr:Calx-beta domain-containing protein [Pirellulaceae bacterium]